MSDDTLTAHMDEMDIAAYVDGDAGRTARAQAHLAVCPECRSEVAEVAAIVRTVPGARRTSGLRFWVPALAAAAVVILLAKPGDIGDGSLIHRQGTVTTIVAPRLISPVGTVSTVPRTLTWASVPLALDYRVRLFNDVGTVLWQRETADTVAAIPASVALRAGARYHWRVDARTGFDRVASSELIEFVVRAPAGRRAP